MSTTGNEVYGEIMDVGQSYVAIGVVDSATAYTPASTQYLAPTGVYAYDPKQTYTPSAYDGRITFMYGNEEGGENKLTVSGVPEKLAAQLLGKPYDSTKGIMLDTGDISNAPWCAVSSQLPFGDTGGNFKLIQFLKGKFALSAINAESRGIKTTPKSRDLTFYPVVTQYQWTMPDTTVKGLKGMTADTTDSAFTVTPAQWFAQIQTPSVTNPASAIALSSSVPANNATGIAATAKPTLTFNNALAVYAGISLIKVSDGSVTPMTLSIDTTGKIVTITPTSNLSSGSVVYEIVVAGVKDIYNQTLATSLVKFTTT
jgi:methionine-rich copper-binding protein CopC